MNKEYYLGLDVGGTKVEGAIATLDSESHTIKIYAKKRIPVIANSNFEEFILALSQLINDLLKEAQLSLGDLAVIGLGLPGSLDPKSLVMLNGNTTFLIGHDVTSALKNKLGFKGSVIAENDANLFTLAESWGGAGLQFMNDKKIPFHEQIAIGVTLGTGVGGGLIAKGKIYSGAHSTALEVGHISLNFVGKVCYCGQLGCAETYLSGTALNKIQNSKEIFEKAKAKEVIELKILSDYRQNLIHFMSILNNLFNPHYFVFGGGLSAQEILFVDLKKDLEKKIFLSPELCPEIYINRLGDSAGLFGAMIYAKEF